MDKVVPVSAPEQEIIEGCKKGNPKAQRELYERLAPRMFPVCVRYMGDAEAARDVLQDGFVTLFGKLGSYRGQGSFEGWARRIFVTTALMELRRKNALREADEIGPTTEFDRTGSSAFEELSAKELLQIVASMPDSYRAVFNLFVFEELSHQEIAATLGISEVASRSQLSRARAWLQKELEKAGYER